MSALASPASNQPSCPCCGGQISPLDLLFDEKQGLVVFGGGVARLTPSQFRLFRALADTYPRVATKEFLLDSITDPSDPNNGPEKKIVDVMICRMRHLLDPLGIVIVTQWGVGFSVELPEGEAADNLRRRRFDESRTSKSTPTDGDIAVVRMLRSQGYRLTDIARKAKLTYRAVGKAVDAIEEEDRKALAAAAPRKAGRAA